ncbi:Uncharacterized protein TCM_040284 [Theobroma cacao]|uniref:Uncharacterized protein n=1 Tax=Theobroma cacao TaxID=3641 RepID=A0A061GS97_THECC|nr:Uncharacterized protein TCM_040284 [Theobroma cacao]
MGVRVSDWMLREIVESIDCRMGNFPMVYFRLSLGRNTNLVQMRRPKVEKVETRLVGWKTKFLSIAKKDTLLRFILASLSIFYMFIFLMLKGVIRELEKIDRRFLRVSSNMQMAVSDGSRIMFWVGRWMDGRVMKEVFPKIYALARNKQRLIEKYGSWAGENWI